MNISIEVVKPDQMRPNVDGADWFFEQESFCETCSLAFVEPGTDVAEHYCSKLSCDHRKMAHKEWLRVKIEPLSDPRYEACLAIHEVFEAVLCRFQGVSHEEVDAFDIPYEATHSVKCNAGDEADAPYRLQHMYATSVERIMAGVLGINWIDYEKELETL